MSAASPGRQLRCSLVVMKKNVMLYYLKPPVLIFGILFPVVFFMAFSIGRKMSPGVMVPGMVSMVLWFTATAVGPLVTPWERRAKTYERLVSAPVSIGSILAGDVLSGFLFGLVISSVAAALGTFFTDAVIRDPFLLIGGMVAGAMAFSSMGVLLSAPPSANPSNIMLLSNLVRLPLLFVSGVFVPMERMPMWARWMMPLSPLSYVSALFRLAYGQNAFCPVWFCFLILAAFAFVMFHAARKFHAMYKSRGL